MQKVKTKRIKITKTIREKLQNERKRTGVGFSTLLRGNPIKGISSVMTSQWASGKVNTARKSYVEGVFKLYSELPTVNMVALSDEMAERIKNKIKKTGIPLERLLRLRNDVPKELKIKAFRATLSRRKNYNKIWGDYILKACDEYITKKEVHEQRKGQYVSFGALPVKEKTKNNYINTKKGLEPIPVAALKTIKQRHQMIRYMLNTIFKQKNVPKDLNQYMVKNWLYGHTKSAKPEHVQWLLDESKKLLKKLIEE